MEIAYLPQTPHGSPKTRPHGDDDGDVDIDEHQAKRLKNEDSKRVRLQRITDEHAAHVNAVQFGDDTFYTMDSYENDQDLEQPSDPFDLCADEDSLHFKDVPDDLWSDYNMERQP